MIISDKGRQMLKSVSPIYGQSKIMQAVFEAVGGEFDDVDQLSDEVFAQMFPQTATWGVVYWEELLRLKSNKNLPSELRRARVLSKMQTRWPVTPAKMEIYISSVAGKIPVEIIQNVADYTFQVDFMYMLHAGELLNLIEVVKIIEDVKPAHTAYQLCIAFYTKMEIAKKHRTWLFDYVLTDTLLCGTHPDIAIIGRIIACPATIDNTMSVTAFDYVLTGTEPIISTIGVALKTKCDAEVSLSFYGFDYKLCGTAPVPETKGCIEKTNLSITNELTAARFLYPECGELLCGTYPAA